MKQNASGDSTYMGIGFDACVLPTKFKDVNLVQTVDFFYPLIDHPYWMGKIACANVLSDLYAMGVSTCDNMLMILGISTDLNDQQRKIIVPEMMKGFADLAKEAGVLVNGGQTVKNPWMMIGGVASSVVSTNDLLLSWNAKPGDLIVLTKPLGTQVVANAHQWMDQKTPSWELIKDHFDHEKIETMYDKAVFQMATLNLNASKLLHKYKSSACTDITGFGIRGHAENLVKRQTESVDFLLHSLPCIENTSKIEILTNHKFGLLKGVSAETSGGLFICLPKELAQQFCDELMTEYSQKSWIIGSVEVGSRKVLFSDSLNIINV